MNDEIMTGDISKLVTTEQHLADVDILYTAILSGFHGKREKTYRMSFAKRGHIGIWMNLARKYDRIDGLMDVFIKEKRRAIYITLIDTLVDLALYSLKWLAIIRQFDRDIFSEWLTTHYEDVVNDYDEDLGSVDKVYDLGADGQRVLLGVIKND